MKKTFHITTFGCQMNARDSQWLAATLQGRGYTEAPLESAAVIILNTCSVREKPEQKVKSFLNRAAAANPEAMIAVAGCVAQQLGAKLQEICPQVRLVAGADGIAHLPCALDRLLAKETESAIFLDFDSHYAERELDGQTKVLPTAFVNIMQGCDNFCAYCIVPFTRGRQKSRGSREILRECQLRLQEGSREIVLLGQNVNAWNGGPEGFSGLLAKIARLSGLKRLRFVTSHPKDVDDELIEVYGREPVLAPALHLPLQAGSDRILKAMRRRYTAEEYLRLVEKLRRAKPTLALATDLIVGFPGETEADFQETLAMVKACGFATGFSFCYSDRPGTRASLMPNKVDRDAQLDRLLRLQAQLESQSQAWLAARVGQKTEILLEGPNARRNGLQGRDPWGITVNIPFSEAASGSILPVIITEAKKHSLMARAAED